MAINYSKFIPGVSQPVKQTGTINYSKFLSKKKEEEKKEEPAKPINQNAEKAKFTISNMFKSGQATTAPISTIPARTNTDGIDPALKVQGEKIVKNQPVIPTKPKPFSDLFKKNPERKEMTFNVGEGLSEEENKKAENTAGISGRDKLARHKNPMLDAMLVNAGITERQVEEAAPKSRLAAAGALLDMALPSQGIGQVTGSLRLASKVPGANLAENIGEAVKKIGKSDFIDEYSKLKKQPKFMPISQPAKEIKIGKITEEAKAIIKTQADDVVVTKKSLKHIADKPEKFPEDVVRRIPDIIQNPSEILEGKKLKTGEERFLFVKRNGGSAASVVEVSFEKNKNTVITVFKSDDKYLQKFKPLWKTGASSEAVLPSASAREALAGSRPEFSALKEAESFEKGTDNINVARQRGKVKSLAEREQDLIRREMEANLKKDFGGELENQYQAFKPLIRKLYGSYANFIDEAEDYAKIKTKALQKGILGEKIDNLLYSQEQSGDEVLDMFKDRIIGKVENKGVKTELTEERVALNQEIKTQKKLEKRGLKESYLKMRETQKEKKISDEQLKRLREKTGAKEWKNTSKTQIDDMRKELSRLKEGDRYIDSDQSEGLIEYVKKEFNENLFPDQAIMTEREVLKDYGIVLPKTRRGGIRAPILELELWKDGSAISLSRETLERNLERVAGSEADEIKNFVVNPTRKNETARIEFTNGLRTLMNDTIVKDMKIRVGSKEDALIQRFGEQRMVQQELWDQTKKIAKQRGVKKYKDLISMALQDDVPPGYPVNFSRGIDSEKFARLPGKVKENIELAVNDIKKIHKELKDLGEEGVLKQKSSDKWQDIRKATEYFREIYNDLLDRVNKERAKFGYEPIQKRKDYFRHFTEMEAAIDKVGNVFKQEDLPTQISGLTEFFNPGKPFSTAELRRKGGFFTESAIKGMDNYLDTISKQIYHIDSIQRGRAIEAYIRDAAEVNKKVKLPNLVANLHEYTNLLSGKKSAIDRAAESMLGRKIFVLANLVKQRTSANMIVGNISSALTNFIPFTEFLATTKKKEVAQGIFEAATSVFNKGYFDINGVESDFLKRRYPIQNIDLTKTKKAAEVAGWLFETVDKFTAKSVVSGKYFENLKKGMTAAEAILEADVYAGKMLADRSIGQLPNLMGAKIFAPVSQFQTEVNNVYSVITKDMPKLSEGNKIKLTRMIGEFIVYSYLFNEAYEKVSGRRPTIDIGYAISYMMGFEEEAKDKSFLERASKEAEDIAGNLPFVGSITGGRFPIGAGIPSLKPLAGDISDYTDGKWKKELAKPAFYLAPPFGGGQAKKTIEGIGAYREGEVRSKSGKTSLYSIKKSPANKVRTGLFGKYATPEAKEYFEGVNKKTTLPGLPKIPKLPKLPPLTKFPNQK
ncbi:MAG: PBECR2 nuclease fold domain-containing protein [Patescibacteria group bacterium]|jgi:hypothetical protein